MRPPLTFKLNRWTGILNILTEWPQVSGRLDFFSQKFIFDFQSFGIVARKQYE